MKLTRINNTFANLNRLKHILNVFWKYGFIDLIEELELFRYLSVGKMALSLKPKLAGEVEGMTMAERAAAAFQELGPTFIKVGQLLSTRSDMLPPEYIKAFDALKDQVYPFPFEKAREIMEQEIRSPLDKVFKYIDSEPLAAASISQVHAATLSDGSEVVIKVRRPGIRETVETDMRIMYVIVGQLKKRFPEQFELTDPMEIVKEFERIIINEMNFMLEAGNAERFRRNFKEDDLIYIPRIYTEYSSESVLVIERIYGVPVRDTERLKKEGHNLPGIAEQLFNITLKMFFVDGFYHGDLHAGNIYAMKDKKLGLIDFGMVGYMDQEVRIAFYDTFSGMFKNDLDRMVKGYLAIGALDEEADEEGFKNDLAMLSDRYFTQLEQVDLSHFFNDVVTVANRHNMRFPTYFFFVGKTFAVMEGTIKKLDEGFNFEKQSKIYIDKFLRKKFDPSHMLGQASSEIQDLSRFLHAFPNRVDRITKQLAQGKLKFITEMVHRREDQDLVEKLVNRLATAFIVTGMIVGSSIIITSKMDDTIFGMPLLGVMGFSLSFVFGSATLFYIWKSKKW